jgi:hypothetical protein
MVRKPVPARILTIFSTSEDQVERTRKSFETARTTLANARTYGTEIHAAAARQAFLDASSVYADALRAHAHIVKDYAAEVT